jgi:medium-chain acyl-[acyl-carrier-protein] hydrolase
MNHVNHLKVQSFHINRFGEVSTPFLFWYMQEIAWEHAHTLGFGFEHLREDQLFWVLSRFLVKIERRPRWKEEFILETWSRGTDGFFAYRDFRFLDKNEQPIITATSSWLVLDLANRKIQRLGAHNNFPAYRESLLGYDPGRVASPVSDEIPEFFPTLFNEIDINQHFNSGRYLERINNSYSFDFHSKHMLKEMEINFLKEGLPEDRLAVTQQRVTPLEHLCSIIREKDHSELIRARMVWNEKQLG